MTRGWLLMALAACSNGPGVLEITVIPPAGVAEVELYAGALDPVQEPLRPAGMTAAATAWWPRDRHANDVIRVSDSAAMYVYGGDDDVLGALVAVGYDGAGLPVAVGARIGEVAIPSDRAIHRVELPLTAFEPLPRDRGVAAMGPGLNVWGPQEDPRACVQVDHVPGADAYPDVRSLVIATGDDPDCDGLPDNHDTECRPREYLGQGPLQHADLSCTHAERISDGVSMYIDTCVLGGPTCVDGMATNATCAPTNYCAPLGMCECSSFACNPEVLEEEGSARVRCVVPLVQEVNNEPKPCQAPIDLKLRDATPWSSLECGGDMLVRDDGSPFASTYPVTEDTTIAISTVDAATCHYAVTPTGLAPRRNGQLVDDATATLSVPLASPTGRGLALPVVFSFEVGLDCAQASCTVIGIHGGIDDRIDESVTRCLAAPPVPGRIVKP